MRLASYQVHSKGPFMLPKGRQMTKKTKMCSKCKETKSIKEFGNQKATKDGLYRWCERCCRAYMSTPERRKYQREYQRERRKNFSEEQRERRRKYEREYGRTEKAKARKKRYSQSEKAREYSRNYRRSDVAKSQKSKRQAIRRTRKTQAGGYYTDVEWRKLCEFYDFCCLKCNGKFPFEKLTIDHVKPVSKGGTSFVWNLQPLCRRCNTSKGAKEIDYRRTLPDWIKRDHKTYHQLSLFQE